MYICMCEYILSINTRMYNILRDGIETISYYSAIMNIRRITEPYYSHSRETPQHCFNHSSCDYALSDPVLIIITLTAVIGSFCLLSGLIILCAVSKTLHDQTSEAILLLGIGFFIYTIAFVTWRITSARRIAHVIEALNKGSTPLQV
ncbi:uncharacterized protein LOC105219914 [Zeugodacus cucurbitae]|uniref:uncharacterized protein LOC105219914 n=1 Tax=Zeugodacus cucurbitae TaxID=28588 RepID=UPI0005968108|nr:uncharacterized protein LOC105219914 [Zeugodacus cucurbitae]